VFLPDLSKPLKTGHTPQEHVTANIVLTSLTIVAAFTLAILLWAILGFRENTHPLIYVTAGLLFAMGIWHIQTLWRMLMLRKHFKQNQRKAGDEIGGPSAVTGKLLAEADFENIVPPSVTDNTTKHLSEKVRSKSS